MKYIFSIFCFIFSLSSQAECQPIMNVDIQIMDFNYTTNHEFSVFQLTEAMKEQNSNHSENSLDFGMVGNVKRISISSVDLSCSHFNIAVDIGYQDSILYIANELKTDTCMYNAIKTHEEGHLTIYREFLTKAKLKINEYIMNKYSNIPVFSETEDYGLIIEADIKKYSFDVLAQVLEEQHAFDISEHKKTSQLCHGALQNLANSIKQQ